MSQRQHSENVQTETDPDRIVVLAARVRESVKWRFHRIASESKTPAPRLLREVIEQYIESREKGAAA